MSLIKTNEQLKGIFGMKLDQAQFIEKLVKTHNLHNFLELGFAHGVSSCYLATILKDQGKGHLTTIDLTNAQTRNPNIETLLDKLNLKEYVSYYYEYESYNWRLMKFIEKYDQPIFDFCYIDGAHDWNVDGFAFLLVDKLLKPGGYLLFDDLTWTFGTSPTLKKSNRVKNMPEDIKNTPHISNVFNILVKKHPNYHNFQIIKKFDWAIAKKKNIWKTAP